MSEDVEKSVFDELNNKHKEFVIEYTEGEFKFNATKSYMAVYGCGRGAAGTNGHKLLRNAKIKAAIDDILRKKWEERKKLRGRILEELQAVGFSDPDSIVNWDGEQAEIKPFDDVDTRAISSIKIKKLKSESAIKKDGTVIDSEVVEIKFHDKNKALAEAAKITGASIQKYEVEIKSFADWVKNVTEQEQTD